MKRQVSNRLCAPLIHDVLERFCNTTLDANQALEKLGVSRSRLYALRTEYLRARAQGKAGEWMPGRSGGDRVPEWPPEVEQFLRHALPLGYNHAFAASEALRLFQFATTRSSVRRWALARGLAEEQRPACLPAHTRRWQRGAIGELWQLDATPHPWFGPDLPAQPLLDMIDDASRLQVGIRLCRAETTAEYVCFFKDSFEKHGLPLCVYVDNATFFRSPKDGVLTALGQRLAFYGVSLQYATTPQSKGKVERIHQVWQDRLPPFFRLNALTPESDLARVNATLDILARHRNAHDVHREIGMFPKTAWDAARAAGNDKTRPVPRDAWWPFVWSLWRRVAVGVGGRVFHQDMSFPTSSKLGEKVILCEHGQGCYSVIENLPGTMPYPVVLFSNMPKPAV